MYSALKIIIKNIKALKNKYFGVKYYPSDIILEVTNRCNLACEYCPAHGKNSERYRKEGDMDKAVWKKIINDAGKWKRRVNIQIAGFGEPLLYKNINELILYAKERNNIRIGLFTNGMLLSDNIIENMVKNKMDWICFSLGGLDSKINDSMRVGSKLETIECNIFKLIEEKKRQLSDKPEIMINIAAPRLDIIQKEEYLDKWLPNVSKITVPGIRDFNKSYKEECDHLRKTIDWSGCYFLYNWFVVNYDGSVSICCEDYNGKIILGNIIEDKISNIFNNGLIKYYRERHEKQAAGKLEICGGCIRWAIAPLHEEVINKKGMKYKYTKTIVMESYEKM